MSFVKQIRKSFEKKKIVRMAKQIPSWEFLRNDKLFDGFTVSNISALGKVRLMTHFNNYVKTVLQITITVKRLCSFLK